jgi:hypothetical protein
MASNLKGKSGINSSDYQLYAVGRLPEQHLEGLARRAVAIRFLEHLWGIGASSVRVQKYQVSSPFQDLNSLPPISPLHRRSVN